MDRPSQEKKPTAIHQNGFVLRGTKPTSPKKRPEHFSAIGAIETAFEGARKGELKLLMSPEATRETAAQLAQVIKEAHEKLEPEIHTLPKAEKDGYAVVVSAWPDSIGDVLRTLREEDWIEQRDIDQLMETQKPGPLPTHRSKVDYFYSAAIVPQTPRK